MKHSVKIAPERRKDKAGNLIVNNVPIFADIRFSGTRIFYFTGYRMDSDKFDIDSQQAKKNSKGKEGSNDIKDNIMNIRFRKIVSELDDFFPSKTIVTKDQIKTLLDEVCKKAITPEPEADNTGFFEMFRKYHDVCNLSQGRKKRINVAINHWQRFEAARGLKITFESITVDLLRDFEDYLKNESTSPRGKSKVFVSSHLSKNTVYSVISLTRAYWNFARKELKQQGMELQSLFGKDGHQLTGEVYGKPVYITIEERNILFRAELSSEHLQRVRDIFVFQCLIGARVGDLCKLTKANIQNNTITYIPRKTKEGKPVAVSVPLHPMALEILSRYDLPDGRLLPFITDQRYNVNLKNLFKELEINRIVTRLNPTTGEPEQVPICDIASSHMARRAFIGNLYGKVDSGIISSMSGHVAGSKAFTRYYDVSKELQQDAISKL
ncbi:MAG: phage integrase SAM-like domain-containing protein [Bacteroidota bacterium]